MNLESCLEAIRSDADRMAACAEGGDLDAAVAGCPGWDLRKLVVHTGFVHRWATHAIQNGAPAGRGDVEEPSPDATGEQLGTWIRAGAGVLADALAATSPDADTWHPFPLEQKAWVWSRRQAMETMVHRWDAEVATTGSSDLESKAAATGLTEFFEMLLPRTLIREGNRAPSASLHVHCTDDDLADGAGEWIVWGENGEYRMETVHRKGDAALRGSAEALLLAVMGRTAGGDGLERVDLVGDPAAATAWLDLPGL